MSNTLPTAAPSQREAQSFIRNLGAKLGGRARKDASDPVLRNSYDEDDRRAKPWQRLGDGSRAQWGAYKRALVRTLKEHIVEQRRTKHRGADRLQPLDLIVLETLLDHFNPQTAELFPSHQRIAELSGVRRETVCIALQRLRGHGYMTWVRRTVKVEDAEGQAMPQRKQTSNAYHFDWRRRMAKRTWMRFWQLVVAGLKKLGTPIATGRPAPKTIDDISSPQLKFSLGRLGALIPSAS